MQKEKEDKISAATRKNLNRHPCTESLNDIKTRLTGLAENLAAQCFTRALTERPAPPETSTNTTVLIQHLVLARKNTFFKLYASEIENRGCIVTSIYESPEGHTSSSVMVPGVRIQSNKLYNHTVHELVPSETGSVR